MDSLVLILLLAASLWVYRADWTDMPRGDQLDFMRERAFHDTDADYFLAQLSFNRTRVFYPGDFYQYRPGYNGYLALMDIFFRDRLLLPGLTSLVIHALTAFALYLFWVRYSGRAAAVPAAAAFTVQSSGMEMVMWRHISPYMLALFFLMAGLGALDRVGSSRRPAKWGVLAGSGFFLAMMFHETTMVLVAACGILFAAVSVRRQGQSTANAKQLVWICLVPVLIYWVLNLIDILHYRPAGLFGSDQAPNPAFSWLRLPSYFAFVAGLAFTAFFFPGIVQVTYPNIFFRGYWYFDKLPAPFIHAGGIFLLAFFAAAFFIFILKYHRSRDGMRSVAGIFISLYMGVLVLGLVFGRVLPHTVSYLAYSTYYYYITAYLLWGLAALLLSPVFTAPKERGFAKRVCWVLLAAFSVYQIGFGYPKIQKALAERSEFDRTVAETAREVARGVSSEKNACYGGPLDSLLGQYATPTLMFNRRCRGKEEKNLYGVAHPAAGFWLAEYMSRPKQPAELDLAAGDFAQEQGRVFSKSREGILREGRGVVLSRQNYDLAEAEVRMHGVTQGGLIAGYRDPGSFLLIRVHDGTASAHVMAAGRLSPPLYQSRRVLNRREFTLSLRQIGAGYGVFYDGNVLMLLKEFSSMAGRVGLYDGLGEGRQGFSDLAVSARNREAPDIFLKPVARLGLPRLEALYRQQPAEKE